MHVPCLTGTNKYSVFCPRPPMLYARHGGETFKLVVLCRQKFARNGGWWRRRKCRCKKELSCRFVFLCLDFHGIVSLCYCSALEVISVHDVKGEVLLPRLYAVQLRYSKYELSVLRLLALRNR